MHSLPGSSDDGELKLLKNMSLGKGTIFSFVPVVSPWQQVSTFIIIHTFPRAGTQPIKKRSSCSHLQTEPMQSLYTSCLLCSDKDISVLNDGKSSQLPLYWKAASLLIRSGEANPVQFSQPDYNSGKYN